MSYLTDWNNLKNNICPRPNCGGTLTQGLLDTKVSCNKCDFWMSALKFEQIVNNIYKPKVKRRPVEDNLEALNNLGHDHSTLDFTDRISQGRMMLAETEEHRRDARERLKRDGNL